MPHHFTKSTVEASIYCKKCGKMTAWRVVDGRRQYCIPCFDKLGADPVAPQPAAAPVIEQGSLFGGV